MTTRRMLGFGVTLMLALAALWLIGLWRFVVTMPNTIGDPERQTDAIVVLTGGRLRIERGLQLLTHGMAKKLFVSGVHPGVDVAELLRATHQTAERADCCIELGHSADNTVGNARETAAWMAAQGFHSLRLVTASYHMPRSLLEFSRAMPGIEIVPNPVFPELLAEPGWWHRGAALDLVIGEYNKYLASLIRPALPVALIPQGFAE